VPDIQSHRTLCTSDQPEQLPFAEATAIEETTSSLFVKKTITEELTMIQQLQVREERTLEQALFDFAAVKSFTYPYTQPDFPNNITEVATTRWQQLVACWKHAEVFQSIQYRFPMHALTEGMKRGRKTGCLSESK
jgi:hypothetical protein